VPPTLSILVSVLIDRRLRHVLGADAPQRFISAMEGARIPGRGLVDVDLSVVPVTTPELADQAVAASPALDGLRRDAPAVVQGPLDAHAQQWIAVGRPDWRPPRRPELNSRWFVPATPGSATDRPPFGLFTSTAAWGGKSMWYLLLETTDSPSLYPRPWWVWEGEVRGPVREVCSAVDWATLVTEYPFRQGEILFPDWAGIARRYLGVHLTLTAVAATQGVWLQRGESVVTATFWTVESTLWLRWPFSKQRLLHVKE
jgi:hypothetical protein